MKKQEIYHLTIKNILKILSSLVESTKTYPTIVNFNVNSQ